mgnify:CR=1 FL=1
MTPQNFHQLLESTTLTQKERGEAWHLLTIVHRKGATPAGKGELGIFPSTMADIGFIAV